jgi:hypothetical protein
VDIGEFINIFAAARRLENQSLKTGRNRRAEFDAQCFRARDYFLRIKEIGQRNFVNHFSGQVAQHAFRADIENLDDAVRVGGDAGKKSAIENRALQRPGFMQNRLASSLREPFNYVRGDVRFE